MFVNRDLTSASYALLRPLVEAMPSRGIIITENVGYGVKNLKSCARYWGGSKGWCSAKRQLGCGATRVSVHN